MQEVSRLHTIVFGIFTVIYGVFVFSTSAWFYFRGRHDRQLSQRSLFLTCANGLCNGLASVLLMTGTAALTQTPCVVPFIATYFGLLPFVFTQFARILRLVFISRLNYQKLSEKISLSTSSPANNANTSTGVLDWAIPVQQAVIEQRVIRFAVFLSGAAMIWAIVFIFVPKTSISVLGGHLIYECHIDWPYYPFYAIATLYLVIICPISLIILRHIRDEYGIKTDIMITVCCQIPAFIMYFVWDLLFSDIYEEYWSESMFCVIGLLVNHICSVVFPLLRYQRNDWLRYPPSRRDFENVLNNSILFSKLITFCGADWCIENTMFIEQYQTLKGLALETLRNSRHSFSHMEKPTQSHTGTGIYNLPSPTVPTSIHSLTSPTVSIVDSLQPKEVPTLPLPYELKSQFLQYYSTFIKPGTLQVTLSVGVREAIDLAVQKDDIRLDMFDAAKDEVLEMLFRDTFPKFYYKQRTAVNGRQKRRPWYYFGRTIPRGSTESRRQENMELDRM